MGSYITDLPFLPMPGPSRRRYRLGPDRQNSKIRIMPLIQSIVAKQGEQDMEVPDKLQPLISQSVDKLCSLLYGLGNLGPESSSHFDFYAVWPTGLAYILDHGYIPTDKALSNAIVADCVPCVEMILKCDKFSMGQRALEYAGEACDEKLDIRNSLLKPSLAVDGAYRF
ncbi:hypothetical protein BJY04DRAFT_133779 [Aspergillus karnatakaensis]|uniref:uncharacterized protein n=1 Tax=Aspergillus karnatakaensis TaxID=1810916 RepID=UPI003CCC92FB